MNMKKTVVVFSSAPSHPQDAGNRARIFALTKEIQSRGFAIHFVYYAQEGLTEKQKEEMRLCWDSVTFIPKKKEYRLGTVGYYLADDWYQDGLGEQVAEICLDSGAVAIVCNYIFQSKILDYIDSTVVSFIDAHDIFANRHLKLMDAGIAPDYYFTVESEEKKCLSRANYIIAIQKNEADYFRRLVGEEKVIIIPHVVEKILSFGPEARPISNASSDQKKILGFMGSGNSLNVKSLNSFLEVFDRLCQTSRVKLELQVSGSVCSKVSTKNPSVKMLGFTSDMGKFFSGLDIFVNPLVSGTGLKIKTIDALTYQVPVVSTLSGFDGLESNCSFHKLNTIEEFEPAINQLLVSDKEMEHLDASSKMAYVNYLNELNRNLNVFFGLLKGDHLRKKNYEFINKEQWNGDICILTHINFWEKNLGSRLRLYSLLTYLDRQFSIKIFYCGDKKDSDLDKIKSLGFQGKVDFYQDYLSKNIAEQTINQPLTDDVLNPIEPLVNGVHVAAFRKWLKTNCFKSIIVEYLQFSWAIQDLDKDIFTILDTHDVLWKRNQAFKENNRQHHIDISEKEELAIYGLYDAVLAIQKSEYQYINSIHPKALHVPVSFTNVFSGVRTELRKIVFVGGGQQPNVDGLSWFLDRVWCYLSSSKFQLHVYGDVSNVLSGHDFKNVYLHGRFGNTQEIYQDADLAINPVSFGGGLKIKSVEAISHGVPLLSTTNGVEGLEGVRDKVVLLADSAEEWLYYIVALSKSVELRRLLNKNSITYAETNFSEEACYKGLVMMIQDTIRSLSEQNLNI